MKGNSRKGGRGVVSLTRHLDGEGVPEHHEGQRGNDAADERAQQLGSDHAPP